MPSSPFVWQKGPGSRRVSRRRYSILYRRHKKAKLGVNGKLDRRISVHQGPSISKIVQGGELKDMFASLNCNEEAS